MMIFRALLVIVVALVSVEVSGSDESLPPACIVGNHNLQSVPAKSALAVGCPTHGKCDQPADRDAAIPDPETPIKYVSVKFQTVCEDDGSNRPFNRPEAVLAIDWLNSCYEPWRIQFVFDHRTVYSSYFNNIHDDWWIVGDLGSQFSIEPQRNLNILTTYFWCDWEGHRTLCGGAHPPWPYPLTSPTWSVLMTPNHWLYGGLICHEGGHNFGLLHTFGDFGVEPCGPCDEVVGAGNRDSTGDFCSDTPPTPLDPWNDRCAPASGYDRCSGRPWGETPSHVYSIPGVYKTTVMLDASEGQFEATMSREVRVHADHLVVENVEAPPGDLLVRVPIRAKTSIPVDDVDLPLHWEGPADMTPDSASTVGFGSGSFPEPQWLDLDADNGRACLRLWTVDSLAMEPGEGVLADLWFSVDSAVSFAENEIRLENYESCRLQFVTDRGPYVPEAKDGSVLISEPNDCERRPTIRKPSGRRRSQGARVGR